MGRASRPKEETFTNPKKWKKTFHTLVNLLEDQKSQAEVLEYERRLLEDRIRIQYERWVSDVRTLEDRVEQMKMQVKSAEMFRMVEVAKADLVSSLRKKQDISLKLKLGLAEDDLNDFKEWFDILSHRCPDGQVISKEDLNQIVKSQDSASKSSRKKRGDTKTKALEDEIARLKCEYEKLSIKSSSDLSALSTEKEFAWNQYREMESSCNRKLQMKDEEVKKANDMIEELLGNIRRLESLNEEKDTQISQMRAKYCTRMVVAKVEKDQQILGMLGGQRKAMRSSGTTTPALRHCTRSESKRSGPKHGNKKQTRSSSQDKELSSSFSEGSKRKIVDVVETPRLFTSNFKIPKLKSSSTTCRSP